MARPQKAGLDYFPLDVYMEQDDKIALIEAKHGIIGFGVIIKLYKKIYGGNGYYYDWNERNKILFSRYAGVDYQKLDEVIKDAIEWELFDKKLFDKYGILTSKRIQKTYLEASTRKKQVELYKEFLLNGINERINKDNVIINSVNVDINPQNKTKQNKTNKNKDINIILFDYWNSKEIIVHKSLTDKMIGKLKSKIDEGYTEDDIKQAIHCYSEIVKGEQYWFNYKWTLEEFLQRGFEKFKDPDVALNNYLKENKDGKK